VSTEAIYDFGSPLSGYRWNGEKDIIYSEIFNSVSKLRRRENRLAVQEVSMEQMVVVDKCDHLHLLTASQSTRQLSTRGARPVN